MGHDRRKGALTPLPTRLPQAPSVTCAQLTCAAPTLLFGALTQNPSSNNSCTSPTGSTLAIGASCTLSCNSTLYDTNGNASGGSAQTESWTCGAAGAREARANPGLLSRLAHSSRLRTLGCRAKCWGNTCPALNRTARPAPSPFAHFVPELPHVILLGLRQALLSY